MSVQKLHAPLRSNPIPMETREFAERVLFATSLEEKLTPVCDLTDHEPGAPFGTPEEPGRPTDLRLRTDGIRAEFPGEAMLMDEERRGILLHFFANHELLATELMALVLLKFPDAPPSFRCGIVRTLEEEQQHTKWYLRRMQECGVQFGDFPLNRFFWDSIAPMETPLDYVTRLSLTFEQANLDYARHYAGLMRNAGDTKTSKILDRIYRDEIGHVGYGLKWFRRWKAQGDSDWEAYQRQLPFPLSPARGRGTVPFNTEGRRKAGFTDDFIREIEVFSRSKGRTPNVFWFTPDAEARMAHGLDGKCYEPRAEIRTLARDLEILPAFLCRRDDVVLMRNPPSSEHRRKLHGLGFDIPEFELLSEGGAVRPDSLQRSRKLNGFRPWAWCPQSAALFSQLDATRISSRWNAEIRRLFAKDWQAEKLGTGARICRTLDELESIVCDLRDQGYREAVAKAPYGAAAQKNRKFATATPEALRPWVDRVIAQQDAVLVEPWLQRVFDFSVQFEMDANGGLRRLAFVQLENDLKGQFRACVAGPKFCRGVPEEIARFLMGGASGIYEDEVPARLGPLLREAGYRGPVGIDAFVFRALDGTLQIRPIVEMNPRFTMGRLTWELMRRVAAGRAVRFELIRNRNAKEMAARLETANPPVLGTAGKLASGTVVLNEPTAVLAVLSVGR